MNDVPRDPTSLDGAILHADLINLEFCRVVKSIDDNGRRLIAVGTRLGPLIVYNHGGEIRPWYSDSILEIPNFVLGCLRYSIKLAGLIGRKLPSGDAVYSNLGISFEKAYALLSAK